MSNITLPNSTANHTGLNITDAALNTPDTIASAITPTSSEVFGKIVNTFEPLTSAMQASGKSICSYLPSAAQKFIANNTTIGYTVAIIAPVMFFSVVCEVASFAYNSCYSAKKQDQGEDFFTSFVNESQKDIQESEEHIQKQERKYNKLAGKLDYYELQKLDTPIFQKRDIKSIVTTTISSVALSVLSLNPATIATVVSTVALAKTCSTGLSILGRIAKKAIYTYKIRALNTKLTKIKNKIQAGAVLHQKRQELLQKHDRMLDRFENLKTTVEQSTLESENAEKELKNKQEQVSALQQRLLGLKQARVARMKELEDQVKMKNNQYTETLMELEALKEVNLKQEQEIETLKVQKVNSSLEPQAENRPEEIANVNTESNND